MDPDLARVHLFLAGLQKADQPYNFIIPKAVAIRPRKFQIIFFDSYKGDTLTYYSDLAEILHNVSVCLAGEHIQRKS